MAFYKVVDQEILNAVEEVFKPLKELRAKITSFCERMGLQEYAVSDTFMFGVQLASVGIRLSELDTLDKTKWKTKKDNNTDYLILSPRKQNKEFYKFYEDNFPKETYSYAGFLDLLLNERYCQFTQGGMGYIYSKSLNMLVIEASSYTMKDGIQEIMESEYLQLKAAYIKSRELLSAKAAEV